jgi:hypothetical protein
MNSRLPRMPGSFFLGYVASVCLTSAPNVTEAASRNYSGKFCASTTPFLQSERCAQFWPRLLAAAKIAAPDDDRKYDHEVFRMSLIETFSSRGDVADLLPERAREKYISLRQQADDEHARLSPVLQQIAEVRNDRQTLAGRLKRLTDPRATGGFGLDETEIQTRDVQAKVGKFDAEIARLSELQQVRSFRWRERAGLIQNVEAYITQGRPRGTIFSPVATEPPTVKKGESVIDAIEGRRRRLSGGIRLSL